jgi:murein DD-endopeptidase MepM/ murein hydrolase activator NlpD
MRVALLAGLLMLSYFLTAQTNVYPRGYFRYPLGIPPRLNANFGEMRPNHFHMGLDLFTERRENLPVYAAAEGYVARVKIEPGGFGRAIYLNHPNGLTTLYAHMNDFMPELELFIKNNQYQRESWETDLAIAPGKFPVKKGQFIGYSGNTGGSQGPHVHFEIRDTKTEKCLNPLLFGFDIPDNIPPDLARIAVYDRNRSVYEQSPQVYSFVKSASGYKLSGLLKVQTDKLAIALQATDRMSGVTNANGIYSVTVFDGERKLGGFAVDRIGYDQTRYLNAHIDYKTKQGGSSYFQFVFPLEGDHLDMYTFPRGRNYIELRDTGIHQIRLEVRDAYGNTSFAQFSVQRTGVTPVKPPVDAFVMRPAELNVFENDQVQVVLPENYLYDSVYFRYLVQDVPPGPMNFSPVHSLHNFLVPVHGYFKVSLKAGKTIPYPLREKMLILNVSKKDTTVARATWEMGWYKAMFRDFGTFQLVADSQPPVIQISGVKPGGTLSANGRIIVQVRDNYPPVKNFRAELDGKWLMFSRKGRTFTYRMDEHCVPGRHQLVVTVEDEAGNKSVRSIVFTR